MDGDGQREAWDSFYASNGRAWRGNCRLPDPLDGHGRALDIGCGSGKSTSTLIDMGYDAKGVDISVEAVSICEERFGGGRFSAGDVTSLPFQDGSFDYIVLVHVLEHVSDRRMADAVSEIFRVLSPGGYVFVRDFAPGDMRESGREGNPIDYFHRNPDDINRFFAGFEVIDSELVEERTRFGAIRRRSEILFRKPNGT